MNRRFTAWKKSRTYGDIYGGRERLRLSDNIFARAHSLNRPNVNDDLPILIEENPSRDFFFPITVFEAQEALKSLPAEDYDGITQDIWGQSKNSSSFYSDPNVLIALSSIAGSLTGLRKKPMLVNGKLWQSDGSSIHIRTCSY